MLRRPPRDELEACLREVESALADLRSLAVPPAELEPGRSPSAARVEEAELRLSALREAIIRLEAAWSRLDDAARVTLGRHGRALVRMRRALSEARAAEVATLGALATTPEAAMAAEPAPEPVAAPLPAEPTVADRFAGHAPATPPAPAPAPARPRTPRPRREHRTAPPVARPGRRSVAAAGALVVLGSGATVMAAGLLGTKGLPLAPDRAWPPAAVEPERGPLHIAAGPSASVVGAVTGSGAATDDAPARGTAKKGKAQRTKSKRSRAAARRDRARRRAAARRKSPARRKAPARRKSARHPAPVASRPVAAAPSAQSAAVPSAAASIPAVTAPAPQVTAAPAVAAKPAAPRGHGHGRRLPPHNEPPPRERGPDRPNQPAPAAAAGPPASTPAPAAAPVPAGQANGLEKHGKAHGRRG